MHDLSGRHSASRKDGGAPLRRIVMTGFMGAGKSTVGRLLAAKLGWPFLDIDALIVRQQDMTVAEIFARHGEAHFRALEAEAIAAVLSPAHNHPRAVIALGGGAIETESVRAALYGEDAGIATVYLAAPLEELLARCGASTATDAPSNSTVPVRPLLAAAEPPDARLARRLPHYRQASVSIETAGLAPEIVVEHILKHTLDRVKDRAGHASACPESRL